nr:BV-like protein [Cotesia vestalis bracovirus]
MPIIIHRIMCLIPKEWLIFGMDSLQILICKVIADHHQSSKNLTTYSVRIEGISSRLRYHNGHPWMRRLDDDGEVPDLKEYYGLFVPCVHCTEFMWLSNTLFRLFTFITTVTGLQLLSLHLPCLTLA